MRGADSQVTEFDREVFGLARIAERGLPEIQAASLLISPEGNRLPARHAEDSCLQQSWGRHRNTQQARLLARAHATRLPI